MKIFVMLVLNCPHTVCYMFIERSNNIPTTNFSYLSPADAVVSGPSKSVKAPVP